MDVSRWHARLFDLGLVEAETLRYTPLSKRGPRAVIHHILLNNFRKFSNFALSLRKGNILVVPNNAGKSSILDALRILDACLRHVRTRNPSMLDMRGEGVFPG